MDPKILSTEAADFLEITLQGLHKLLKSKNLEYNKSKNRVYFGHKTAKELFDLKLPSTCWSWQNLKGGVGKTNLSFSTAIRLSLYGLKVAVIDLDQQGNFTHACNVDPENKPIFIDLIKEKMNITDCMIPVIDGLDILPSRIDNALLDNTFSLNTLPIDREIKKQVFQLKKYYDFVFIDCPPSLGASVCSASLAADYILIPLDPEKFSLSGVDITLKELKENVEDRYEQKLKIKIVLNKFDARTSLSHLILSNLHKDSKYSDRLLKSFIRTSQEFPNCIAKNKNIFDTLKSTPSKEDIDFLAREIIETCTLKCPE